MTNAAETINTAAVTGATEHAGHVVEAGAAMAAHTHAAIITNMQLASIPLIVDSKLMTSLVSARATSSGERGAAVR